MGNLFQGTRSFAQDFETFSYDSTADTVSSGNTFNVAYGISVVNFSGLGAGIVAILPSGIETTTQSLYIKNSDKQSANTVISGTVAAQTIDGASTYTLTGTNASVQIVNYSGQAWISLGTNF